MCLANLPRTSNWKDQIPRVTLAQGAKQGGFLKIALADGHAYKRFALTFKGTAMRRRQKTGADRTA